MPNAWGTVHHLDLAEKTQPPVISCSKQCGPDQWAVLAGLRFFLAATVLLGHITSYFVQNGDWLYLGDNLNQEGGVFGFFLISGYSIAASTDREQTGYFARRARRIWPLYLTTIVFGLIVSLAVRHANIGGPVVDIRWRLPFDLICSLLMLQSFASTAPVVISPIWSLSIEWWLYMVAPALKKVPTAIIGCVILVSALYFITKLSVSNHPWRWTAWLWLLGFVYHRHRNETWSALILIVPYLVLLRLGAVMYAQTPLTIGILICCRNISLSSDSLRKALNYLGDLSYPLYLLHMPAIILAVASGLRPSFLLAVAAVCASVAALHLVDYPCRTFRRDKAPIQPRKSSLLPSSLTPD